MSNDRLDYVPGDSIFHRMHVVVKLTIMVGIVVLMFTVSNIWILAGLLFLTLAIYQISNVSWGYVKGLKGLIPTLLFFLILTQALWYSGNKTPIFNPIMLPFRINFSADGMNAKAFALYYEGVYFGIVLALRMIGMFLTFPIIFLTTPTQELMAGLTEVGVPYQGAFIFTIAFRFIPLIHESRERVMEAQRLRGIELEGKGLIKAVKQTVPTIVPMITSMLRMTTDLENAIASRAFGAYKERTMYRGRGFSNNDRVLVFLTIFVVIIFAVGARIAFPGRGL